MHHPAYVKSHKYEIYFRTTSYQTPPNAASDSHTKIPSANISSTSYVSLTGSQLLISPERVTSELKILQPERLRRFPIRQPLLVDVASESVPFDADLLQVSIIFIVKL